MKINAIVEVEADLGDYPEDWSGDLASWIQSMLKWVVVEKRDFKPLKVLAWSRVACQSNFGNQGTDEMGLRAE